MEVFCFWKQILLNMHRGELLGHGDTAHLKTAAGEQWPVRVTERDGDVLMLVLLSLGVLLEDFIVVVVALVVGVAGVMLEVVLGKAAINGLGTLF